MKNNSIDWFTRIIAISGLLLSIVAIGLPYYQAQNDAQEMLFIDINPEHSNSIIKLSDDINKSKAIQIPYIITLSNTGKVKLSVVSYTIHQMMKNQSIQMFSGLNGGIYTINNNPIQFPKNIDAGESIRLKIYIGFLPTDKIQNYLQNEYKKNGILRTEDVLIFLAKKGLTLYGGKANYKDVDNSYLITIDPLSYLNSPKYLLQFKTGRKNNFIGIASEYRQLNN